MIEKLQKLNESLNVNDIRDKSFLRYGRVLESFPAEKLVETLETIAIPEEGNRYIPSLAELENRELKSLIERKYYGAMSCQIGYCNGRNSNLGGLEYHKGSEINVAVTDMVLLLGHLNEVEQESFDTTFLKAFYIPKGTAIEIYQTTLHLAPCKVTSEGFKCVVILPEGTNTPLNEEEKREDSLLYMKNKWLLAHEEHLRFVSNGAHVGIKGPNVFVQFLENELNQGGRS
ncbi:DUF4867 family protein [Jeotgalibacillus sp. S-D1]|uniref:DUF4867 family protein n=1 Tax=Jeotgalibacillus sp. S-D1 TaxID=2552189 RepID=UPI0010598899|nr:DUF4867 family protein [Jeotgalibacillus sp. S-D1]TDL31190.1 DUF4867 family protein [Jeotgalibacillus sp. S-D1]